MPEIGFCRLEYNCGVDTESIACPDHYDRSRLHILDRENGRAAGQMVCLYPIGLLRSKHPVCVPA